MEPRRLELLTPCMPCRTLQSWQQRQTQANTRAHLSSHCDLKEDSARFLQALARSCMNYAHGIAHGAKAGGQWHESPGMN